MKVAIIERDRFGGTCVNTGCTPTKTLVAERLCRAHGAARRRLRFQHRRRGHGRHEARQGARRRRRRPLQPRCRAIAQESRELHRLPRPRALRVGARGCGRHGNPELRPDLHQRGRPGRRARDAWPGANRLSHQQLDGRSRCPAAASPGGRRQLHRARVRPDVSPLRQRGHGRGDGAAPRGARG